MFGFYVSFRGMYFSDGITEPSVVSPTPSSWPSYQEATQPPATARAIAFRGCT